MNRAVACPPLPGLLGALCALLVLACPLAAADLDRRPIDVEAYNFELGLYDDTDAIAGRATVRVRFLADGLRALGLDLVGPATAGGRGMEVLAVDLIESDDAVAGVPVPFHHHGDRLELELRDPVHRGETRSFRIVYQGVPADGLVISLNRHGERTFFGDNWPERARHWLPSVDHPADKALCSFAVTAPAHYQVIANGTLRETTDSSDGRRRTVYGSDAPLATKVMVIGAGRFAVERLGEVAGVPVESWVYPQDRDAGFRTFAPVRDILPFFVDRLGAYPYSKLANVQSTIRFGGMENAGSIFYKETAIGDSEDDRTLIAHELAHQWFGDAVTEADWTDFWLSEGFATYLALGYLESRYGPQRLEAELVRARDEVLIRWREQPEPVVPKTAPADKRELLSPNAYQRGAWVLHMLRREVGEEAFWSALRSFYERYRHGNATTLDWRRELESVAGRSLEWFFEQWLYRAELPRLRGEWRFDPARGELEVKLHQGGAGPPFRLELELGVAEPGGGLGVVPVRLGEREVVLRLPRSSEPSMLVLDPHAALLFDGAGPLAHVAE